MDAHIPFLFQCIGATTLDEHRKHIEKDKALARRFQPVMVLEPSEDDAKLILRGIQDKYEVHHKCKFSAEAVDAAVELSARYIADRFLPDKVREPHTHRCKWSDPLDVFLSYELTFEVLLTSILKAVDTYISRVVCNQQSLHCASCGAPPVMLSLYPLFPHVTSIYLLLNYDPLQVGLARPLFIVNTLGLCCRPSTY